MLRSNFGHFCLLMSCAPVIVNAEESKTIFECRAALATLEALGARVTSMLATEASMAYRIARTSTI